MNSKIPFTERQHQPKGESAAVKTITPGRGLTKKEMSDLPVGRTIIRKKEKFKA